MGIIEVSCFYLFSVRWESLWKRLKDKTFENTVFGITAITRLLWIGCFYMFTMSVWNTPWEQPIGTDMDSGFYYDAGVVWLRDLIRQGDISPFIAGIPTSDLGYPIFLGLWSFISGDSIFLTRLPNAFFDAWTVILTYRLAKRNFGEKIGRLSAIFTLLLPQLLFYAGTTMKESLMLMLAMWAVERGDNAIRGENKVWSIIGLIGLSAVLALFRTALAWVIVLSFLCALLLSSERVMTASRRWAVIIVLSAFGAAFFGGAIMEQGQELVEQGTATARNFEYRAARKYGNKLVANLNKVMFVPIVFTLPFPTMVSIEGQNIQQLQNGGYFLKNVLSFFCIFALFVLLVSKKWRGSVMIIAFLVGYLIALSMSSFIQSGRFHHPVLPVEMVFAAYGMNAIKNIRQARWFDYFLFLEFFIIVFWNWFKLRGRGVV